MFERLYRRSLLAVADAVAVRRVVERYGLRLGVGRFVAGEDLDEALATVSSIQASGRAVILDMLGEYAESEEAAVNATRAIVTVLERLAALEVPPALSVKPTQIGLALDPSLAEDHGRRILEAARQAGTSVCLDMENSPYVERTLQLFESLVRRGHHPLSTVLQSYLHRTPNDLERLLDLDPKPELRLVKGAYREGPEVAMQDKAEVDAALRNLVYAGLEGGAKIDIASHDERLLDEVAAFVRGAGIGAAHYEFQLLYGVRPKLQERLMADGHPVRVYVPFGSDWYGYFSRRLAERPANLAVVVRGLFG